MESLLQRIEEAVKCTICNEIFVNPTILTCNDTFCRRCLEGMVVDGCINCATCSKATILPEGRIEQLDLNGMAKSIVDILLQDPKKYEHCDLCDDEYQDVVVAFCEDCKKSLCEHHLTDHKRTKDTKNHNIVTQSFLTKPNLPKSRPPIVSSFPVRQRQSPFSAIDSPYSYYSPYDEDEDETDTEVDADEQDMFKADIPYNPRRNTSLYSKKAVEPKKKRKYSTDKPKFTLEDLIQNINKASEHPPKSIREAIVRALMQMDGRGTRAQIIDYIKKHYPAVIEQSQAKQWDANISGILSSCTTWFVKRPISPSIHEWCLQIEPYLSKFVKIANGTIEPASYVPEPIVMPKLEHTPSISDSQREALANIARKAELRDCSKLTMVEMVVHALDSIGDATKDQIADFIYQQYPDIQTFRRKSNGSWTLDKYIPIPVPMAGRKRLKVKEEKEKPTTVTEIVTNIKDEESDSEFFIIESNTRDAPLKSNEQTVM